ncbi:terpenoid synthase [Guyanagaster necrorhizus]|uniref:Terpene synthase n=1 Tax=Guyanagaster necrorhizus TaxID=856835 RepID=A0A9P7VKK2_9AGAR|nr:terpenoid synthase [Guyanagaster necrorhizus MCA 3950]KAG7441671.1 terpenoid synthase [Guyanagaster necrorhizus MCA 3950]
MDTQSDVVFRIPDTLAYWPWPRNNNPHYEEVKAVSNTWFRSLKAFRPEAQRAYERCDSSLLASLAYSTATKEHLRTGCDLFHVVFAFDEYTDSAPPEIVRQYADIVMDAIKNPSKPRPTDEVVLGVIAQEFWALSVKSASNTSQKHFIEGFGNYVAAVVQEAKDRHHHHIRNVEDYFDIRRQTVGAYPSYALLELGYDLPDEVFNHPIVVALRRLGVDMIILDNDLASYNKEQALEEYPHNILTSVMNDRNCDLHDALSWVEDRYRLTRNTFLRLWTEIPSWGPETDATASLYLHGLASCVRGNECWNFESGRYFGSSGRAVQQHRMVTLMPKQLSASEPLLVHAY